MILDIEIEWPSVGVGMVVVTPVPARLVASLAFDASVRPIDA